MSTDIGASTGCEDAAPCERLVGAQERADRFSRHTEYYKCVSATKTVGALAGIGSFLALTIGTALYYGKELPIIREILAPVSAEGLSKPIFLWAFLIAIVIHHLRIFCGISYAEQSVELISRNQPRYTIERWLKLFFLVSYPFFAALVKTELIALIIVIWGLQTLMMFWYNIMFKDKLDAAKVFDLVMFSDFLTVAVLIIYAAPALFGKVIGSDTFAADAALVLIIIWAVVAYLEYRRLYKPGIRQNWKDVKRFIVGDY